MTFVLNPEIAQTLGETQPRIQIASRKQDTSLNVVPADSHLKELCEQFENGNHTTISVTDTCAIEIQPPRQQLLSKSDEMISKKEAA